ncbi:MAG: beta-lactamase family protein [Ignavibacteriae bacterium]|nr:beta-lactamase family protein [Ignavibacteriota bacterium]
MVKKFLLIILFAGNLAFSYDFSKIDSIVYSGISNKFYPCAQLIIGYNSDLIYEKSYGNLTYDENSEKLGDYHLFDLASVTKVVAATSAIMVLYENGKINLDEYAGTYLPEFSNNGKENITVRNLLLHNSGLKAWIPFYQYYKTKEEVLSAIFNIAPVNKPGAKFVYSDLNAILLGLIVERVSGTTLDEFCIRNIFYPLGMKNTFFNPVEEKKKYCVPTENDTYWRNKQLQGEVHDEAASILDGVSGNAGLFSTARDLFDFMRMMENKGFYYNPYTRGLKKERLFKEETVDLFTSRAAGLNYLNTRALGWDTKPEPNKYRIPCGESFSDKCFGHTGYTGTSVWCDKDRHIIVILLTNRVYPYRGNEGIKEIRPDLHNEIISLLKNN